MPMPDFSIDQLTPNFSSGMVSAVGVTSDSDSVGTSFNGTSGISQPPSSPSFSQSFIAGIKSPLNWVESAIASTDSAGKILLPEYQQKASALFNGTDELDLDELEEAANNDLKVMGLSGVGFLNKTMPLVDVGIATVDVATAPSGQGMRVAFEQAGGL